MGAADFTKLGQLLKEPISIIITAYDSAEFIELCLDSVEDQDYFWKWNKYEILLGIDACQSTLEKVKSIKHKYRNLHVFMMDTNEGTYITSNTLIQLTKYGRILRFDSDDIMMSDMVKKLSYSSYPKDIQKFRFGCENYYYKTAPELFANSMPTVPDGVALYRKGVFDRFGGFMPWRIAADTEFKKRTAGLIKEHLIQENLFYRRVHPNSLTARPDTGRNSPLRLRYREYCLHEVKVGGYLKPTTNTFQKIP